RKMRERKEFVARFYGDTAEYRSAIDWTRKPGAIATYHRQLSEELQKAENGGPGAEGEEVIRSVKGKDKDKDKDKDNEGISLPPGEIEPSGPPGEVPPPNQETPPVAPPPPPPDQPAPPTPDNGAQR